MARTTYQDLLDAGVHFGHLTRKWNPKMAPYIFMERNGIHIIDLNKTLTKLEEAAAAIKQIVKSGRKIIAKVYYRPEFFKGTNVSWDTRYPYCLEMNGMAAQCTSIDEVIELFQSEI